jgi:hypothetical protein
LDQKPIGQNLYHLYPLALMQQAALMLEAALSQEAAWEQAA